MSLFDKGGFVSEPQSYTRNAVRAAQRAPNATTVLFTSYGKSRACNPGEWMVDTGDGYFKMTDEEFQRHFSSATRKAKKAASKKERAEDESSNRAE